MGLSPSKFLARFLEWLKQRKYFPKSCGSNCVDASSKRPASIFEIVWLMVSLPREKAVLLPLKPFGGWCWEFALRQFLKPFQRGLLRKKAKYPRQRCLLKSLRSNFALRSFLSQKIPCPQFLGCDN